jgi:hypothetical protein
MLRLNHSNQCVATFLNGVYGSFNDYWVAHPIQARPRCEE